MKNNFKLLIAAVALLAIGCSKNNPHLDHALQMKEKIYKLYDVDETPLLAENYPQDVAAEATYLAEGADNKVNKYSYLWPYSGTLSMMSALYEATGDDSILEFIDEEIIEGLKMYHDTSREPYGYSSYITADKSDRFYDDNIWLVIDFVDLYNLTKKQHYLDLALDIWNFVLSGRDTVLGDGIYWCEQKKDTKNTCSNAPAAVAALKLHKATGDKKYYDEAQQTAAACVETWVKKYTNDKEEEIYIVESGDVWFDAVMLRGFLALWRVNQTDMLLEVYHDTLNYAWYMGRDENGLFGKYLTARQEGEDKSWLLTQAAYVEMSARLAAAQKSKEE